MTTYADGLYQYGGMPVGPNMMDVGNIYFVNNSPTSAKGIELTKRFGATRYSDDSLMLHTTPTTAITACIGGRNDYVILSTGTYALTTAITLTGKSSVHLIGQNGLGMDIGTAGAVILRQDGNYTTITNNAFCETAGLQIENKIGYSAIDVPTGIGWTNIHHNLFKVSLSAGIDCVNYGSGASWGSIHHNKFVQWASTGGRACIYIPDQATTAVTVANNDILAFGDGLVWDNGIYHYGLGGLVRDNYIGESGGTAAIGGATITVAINVGVATNVANNRTCVATGQGLNGGTANITFVDNRDGQAGGATAITT